METESKSPFSFTNKPEPNLPNQERKGIKCCFSQINDLTTTINFKENDQESYKSKFESKKSKKSKGSNCECFMTDTGIEIVSKGGSKFNLPLEQKIERVFPLEEGLLIEFHVKHELKLHDLLAMAKLTKEKEEYVNLDVNEENYFSYITLNRHPLNPLKMLGGFVRKNSEKSFKWYRVQEKICYVSKKLPFLISYNFTLHRHAFHYVRLNHEEKVKENNTIQFQNYFFTLHNLHNNLNDNPELMMQSTLSTDMFFEETNKENILEKCKIIKGADISEIYIYMLIRDNSSYVKIYSVDLMNQNYDNPIATRSVRKVSVVNEVRNMFSMSFFQSQSGYPEVYDIKKKIYKSLFEKVPHLKMLTKTVKNLKDNMLLCHYNETFSLFHCSQCLVTYQLNIPVSIQNFLSKTSQYLFISDVINFKDEQGTLVFNGNTPLKFVIVPKIRNFLVSLILKTLAHFFEEKFYERLFSDVILNCLNFESYDDKKFFQPEESDGAGEQFHRLVYYLVFMLKLCNKNGPHTEEGIIISGDEKPMKKIKPNSEDDLDIITTPRSKERTKSFGLKSEALISSKVITEQDTSFFVSTNWNNVCKSKFHTSNSKEFDQLFQKKVPMKAAGLNASGSINLLAKDSQNSSDKKEKSQDEKLVFPKVTLPLDLFYHNRVKIFRILHLLYQEVKVNKLHQKETADLAYLLFCFAKYINHDLGNVYCDYYLRENFDVLERYKSDARLAKMDDMIQHRSDTNLQTHNTRDDRTLSQTLYANTDNFCILEKDPPDLLKWIQTKLFFYESNNSKSNSWESQKVTAMPILFKLTHQICKIFEILSDSYTYQAIEALRNDKVSKQSMQRENLIENTRNPNLIETEVPFERRGDKRTSVLSDMFIKTAPQLLTSLGNDLETIRKFEQEFPFFHYNIIEDQLSSKEDEGFDYKLSKQNSKSKEERIFLYLIKKKMSLPKLSQLCFGISTPIAEVLRSMRQEIPSLLYHNLPKLAFKLIKRDDLYKNLKIYLSEGEKAAQESISTLHGLSNTINNLIRGSSKMPVETFIFTSGSQNKTKTSPDHAFMEANRLLDTVKPMRIKKKYFENVTEDKIEAESQAILLKLCIRRFSVLIGQGALSFATVPTLITEVLKIPKINLSAISPVSNNKITLEFKDEREQAMMNWPEFHNGVANGLKLFKEIIQCDKHHLRIWIFYQRPETPKFEYGGFLLSMGLLGFLDSFMPTDIYQYLKPGHEATSVGILLGLAASRIGKMDEHTSKTLCLHIPYLLPPSYDIEIPLNVQTTAIIGLGLLHLGTSNRIMTEITLAQIGRKPLSDKGLDRDGYSLAAGYALGLINLCKGTNNPIIKDLDLDERLIRFVEGGKPIEPPKSILYSNYNHDFNKCSSVREGSFVNTHITCPSALLALALIYLKSNKTEIAERITIPNSFSDIEFTNPNHILMKIVTRNLIMWDKIESTTDFIYSQIPPLIRFIFERPIKEVQDKYSLVYNVDEIDFNTVSLVYCNIIGGGIMSMGLRYAGTGDQRACETIIKEIEKFKRLKIIKSELINDVSNKNAIDNYNLSTLLCVSVLAMSLIMAGTCDITCLKWCRIVRKKIEETSNMHFGFNMAVHMAIGFLFLGNGSHSFTRSDLSIASLLITIYPHFPISSTDNKYHLQALRHFYILATERRMFYTVDVETNKVVNLKIQLEIENSSGGGHTIENHETPVLIQDSKKCIALKVLDEEYYNVEIKFKDKKLPKEKLLYVRKKYPREVNTLFYKSSSNGNYQNELRLESIKDIKENLGNDINLKLSEFLSKSKTAKNRKEMLLYVFPFNAKKLGKLSTAEEIKYMHEHHKLISAHQDNIYEALIHANKNYDQEKNLVGVYLQLLREDRAELFPLYLCLFYFNEGQNRIDSLFLQNFNIISKFYANRNLQLSINSSESEVFNLVELEKVKTKVMNVLSIDEITKNALYRSYLDKLDINSALNLTERNFEMASQIMKHLVFTNMPSPYDFGIIRACINEFNKTKNNPSVSKSQELQSKNLEEKENKNLINIYELYLYLSFPLCPREVLAQIAHHFG